MGPTLQARTSRSRHFGAGRSSERFGVSKHSLVARVCFGVVLEMAYTATHGFGPGRREEGVTFCLVLGIVVGDSEILEWLLAIIVGNGIILECGGGRTL